MNLQKACFEGKSASQGGLNVPDLKRILNETYPEHASIIGQINPV